MTDDGLLTVDELAEWWKVSPRYIRMLLNRKELPYFKLGRVVRIRKHDAQNYLDLRKRNG